MATDRPLDLLLSEWLLLQKLSLHTMPFYLRDVFILYKSDYFDLEAFYKCFFSLRAHEYITVAHYGNLTDNT